MDDLEALRSRISTYADYDDVDARHLVDKQIRAWAGEALAKLRERLAPVGEIGEELDGLLFRCEFTDQRLLRASDVANVNADLIAHLHHLDRKIVEAADAGAVVEPAGLGAYLASMGALFDQRFGAIISADTR